VIPGFFLGIPAIFSRKYCEVVFIRNPHGELMSSLLNFSSCIIPGTLP
jgi:hypothetical protein